jgi:hypothetical protein
MTGRFDQLARSFSSRLSRRTALKASGAAVALGLGSAATRGVTAQDDASTPVTVDGVTLTEDAFLFVQSATSGTFTVNDRAGTPAADGTQPGGGVDYLLTLEGHTGSTIYFSERIFGAAPTQQFLDGLGFPANNPPNAALVTNDENGNEDTLVVELFAPSYDEAGKTVTYGVNILGNYEGGNLAHAASQQTDEDLAASFGTASLFIDDCPDLTDCIYFELIGLSPNPANAGSLPGGPVGQCWHWGSFSCTPCNGNGNGHYNDICNETYSKCDGNCEAE